MVDAQVVRDPVQPGPQAGTAFKRFKCFEGPQERLLHHVLGFGQGTSQPVAVGNQLAAVRLGQAAECFAVAEASAVNCYCL